MADKRRGLLSIFPDIMLNLDKINSTFDIKDLDAAQIIKILTAHQKTIKLVFLIGSLIVAGGMFNDHGIKEQGLRVRMSQEQVKLASIKARDAAIRDFNNFRSTLPKEINELELITQISNDANLYHTTIVSLNPADRKDMGLYDVIDVKFTAVSDNFKEMILFLRNIEKSNPPLRVNAWAGSEGEDGKISCDIQLSAVHIHP